MSRKFFDEQRVFGNEFRRVFDRSDFESKGENREIKSNKSVLIKRSLLFKHCWVMILCLNLLIFIFTIGPYLLGLESLPVHNNAVFIMSIIGRSCVKCIIDIFRMSV